MQKNSLMNSILFMGFLYFIYFLVSSVSWFMLWMGVEVMNLFIFFFFNFEVLMDVIFSGVIYFWVSVVMGFSILMLMMMNFYFISLNMHNFFSLLLEMSLVFKMGLFPFFMWKVYLMKGVNLLIFFLLGSVVNMPLFFLFDVSVFMSSGMLLFLYMVCLMSLVISMMGVSQNLFKVFIIYSSIGVMGDLMYSYYFDYKLWGFSFFIYMMVLVSLLLFFMFSMSSTTGVYKFKSMILNKNKINVRSLILFKIMMLNLMGLPLMSYFFIKLVNCLFFFDLGMSGFFVFFYFLLSVVMSLNYYRLMKYFFLIMKYDFIMMSGSMWVSMMDDFNLVSSMGLYLMVALFMLGMWIFIFFFFI